MSGLEHELSELLVKKHITIATAESCTGGLIANWITDVPGSSRYFERGVVTYSNNSKNQLLNVSQKIIQEHGAVSTECAHAMALGIRSVAKTDLGLAVTGIAGPSGGTPEKPVGLVYIALATAGAVTVKEFRFSGTRLEIKHQSAKAALEMVIEYLSNL